MSKDPEQLSDSLPEFVNVHGVPIPIEVSNGEILVQLCSIKNTGFKIYKKNQYNKILIPEKEFTNDFDLYLLNAATEYLIQNQFSFNQEKVNLSIERCKSFLIDTTRTNMSVNKRSDFMKNRQILEESKDNNLQIKICGAASAAQKSVQGNSGSFKRLDDTQTLKQVNTFSSCAEPKRTSSPQNQLPDQSNPTLSTEKNYSISISSSENVFPRYVKEEVLSSDKHQFHDKSISRNNERNNRRFLKTIMLTFGIEYEVLVTHVIKNNDFFVQVKKYESQLKEIFMRTQREEPEMKFVEQCQLNNIYMTKDEKWFRCKIVKLTPLTAFMIDYGNTVEVDQVKEVSDELASYPAQAIKIIVDPPCFSFKIEAEMEFVINPHQRFPLGYMAELKSTPPKTYFQIPNYLCDIKDGQVVCIISEDRCTLFLRTYNGFQALSKIAEAIDRYVSSNDVSLDSVKRGQLILAKKLRDNKFYRAVVKKIEEGEKRIHIKYLDYNEEANINLTDTRNINEELANEPITYFLSPTILEQQKISELNEKCKNFIQMFIEKRTKFKVKFDKPENFDLIWKEEEQNLSLAAALIGLL